MTNKDIKKVKKLLKKYKKEDIIFSSQKETSKHYYEIMKFIENVFNIDAKDFVFLSDESSLHDFLGQEEDVESIPDVVKKVKKKYGVDISKVKDKPLFEILEYIKRQV